MPIPIESTTLTTQPARARESRRGRRRRGLCTLSARRTEALRSGDVRPIIAASNMGSGDLTDARGDLIAKLLELIDTRLDAVYASSSSSSKSSARRTDFSRPARHRRRLRSWSSPSSSPLPSVSVSPSSSSSSASRSTPSSLASSPSSSRPAGGAGEGVGATSGHSAREPAQGRDTLRGRARRRVWGWERRATRIARRP
jgi:hypothetical protein